MNATADTEVATLIHNARLAQADCEHYSQAQVDELVTAVCWAVVEPASAEQLATLAVNEGGFGHYTDKFTKIRNRCMGTLQNIKNVKTVGVVEELPELGLIKIAKPVGVIAALIPITGPDATPPLKTLLALKGRNAIIISGHPKAQKTTALAVEKMRAACQQVGAPPNLIQLIENPSLAKTQALMQQADLILATGGAAMVKAAYSSGTPAFGVGVGNTVHIVDETADLQDAANCIANAKKFDYATSCLADKSIVVHESIYQKLLDLLTANSGYLCDDAEKSRLQAVIWTDGDTHIPSVAVIAKSAQTIAQLANINVPDACDFLMVEEQHAGKKYPFSGEKLCPVLTIYRYHGGIEQAIAQVNAITAYQGQGHTCGIHSQHEPNIMAVALNTKTARVMVNQNLNEGAGSLRNAMPYTLSLSCGTWGGNITTENINVRHLINLTWVSRPIAARSLDEQQLFAQHWEKYGK
ncbi:succinate-semialdehyde dehydrogenase [uncultured bacterium]|nr:succinate-semialdehyde dehydrogenase [uncultured bacterium]